MRLRSTQRLNLSFSYLPNYGSQIYMKFCLCLIYHFVFSLLKEVNKSFPIFITIQKYAMGKDSPRGQFSFLSPSFFLSFSFNFPHFFYIYFSLLISTLSLILSSFTLFIFLTFSSSLSLSLSLSVSFSLSHFLFLLFFFTGRTKMTSYDIIEFVNKSQNN
jgi:hypothetical protein